MKYPVDDGTFTLHETLARRMTAEELKKLLRRAGQQAPRKKTDLVQAVLQLLSGSGLQKIWQELDELQKRAVAEVTHSSRNHLDNERFLACYGKQPDWGNHPHDSYRFMFTAPRRSFDRSPSVQSGRGTPKEALRQIWNQPSKEAASHVTYERIMTFGDFPSTAQSSTGC